MKNKGENKIASLDQINQKLNIFRNYFSEVNAFDLLEIESKETENFIN